MIMIIDNDNDNDNDDICDYNCMNSVQPKQRFNFFVFLDGFVYFTRTPSC